MTVFAAAGMGRDEAARCRHPTVMERQGGRKEDHRALGRGEWVALGANHASNDYMSCFAHSPHWTGVILILIPHQAIAVLSTVLARVRLPSVRGSLRRILPVSWCIGSSAEVLNGPKL